MNCTGKRCLAQYNKVDPATCTAVPYCPQATPPKTNADRIRSMTDEELSCFLTNAYALGAIQEKCRSRAWLRWLTEEVKE